MKKIITVLAIVLCAFTATAQNATKDAAGNYTAVKHTSVKPAVKSTGKTFTDVNGKVYPVYESAKGKLYYVRTSKSGNEYKVYIKVN